MSYLISGGTLILWDLLPTFTDPGPLSFQVQVGKTDNNNADDWTDVGLPVVDQFFAIDPVQRVYGKDNWTFYRLLLTTAKAQYVSEPVDGKGTLGKRDWLKARNIARFNRVRFRLGAGQDGYLLKRRVTGIPCHTCLDYQTQEVTNPDCVTCYGTGFECGYFYPMACVWSDMSPKARRIHIDEQARGTINDIVVKARMILTGLLVEDDVWVNRVTDDRYFIHEVQNIAEVRGFPVLGNVEMRPIPYSSVIYTIAIPQQLQDLLSKEV